jgi:transcriptional regulator GlxA family with amidase domain
MLFPADNPQFVDGYGSDVPDRSALRRLERVRDPRFHRLAIHVRKNLDKHLSLAQAAGIVGLERTYFSRVFRDLAGLKFSDWIRTVRIERAGELLSTSGRITIMSVALTVGYRDLTTFERAFKQCKGISPRDYRVSCMDP